MKLNAAQRKKLFFVLKWVGPIVAMVVFMLATNQMSAEKKEQSSPTQIAFEDSPSDWLSHPKDASDFLKSVDAGQVEAVGVGANYILYTTKDGKKFSARVVCSSIINCESLTNLGALSTTHNFKLVAISIDPSTGMQKIFSGVKTLFGLLYALMMFALVYVFIKTSGISIFSSDKPELAERPTERFDDIIGAEEAKAALTRVRTFLKDPKAYAELGAKAPRGVLMEGGPGTGKTLLARALAGECGVNFIPVDGSYFTSMFYGAGVTKVKELFKFARDHAPAILWIDEIDGIGSRQSGGLRGGEQEQNRIINRILTEMDGFNQNDEIIVIGATNHATNVDPAMRRPGRFDMVINVGMPTPAERAKVFDLYLKKVKADPAIDLEGLGRMSAGLSPADIANLVNKAVSTAAEQGAKLVTEEHLFRALETHQLGGEVNSNKSLLTEETRERLAYHEAAHAVVGHLTGVGSVDRISIEPRGMALGVTFISRLTEEPLFGEKELQGRVAMTLAGREGELMMLGNVSSGASDDLEKATGMATTMVGNFGFSSTFGLLSVKGIPKELLGPDTQRELLLEARSILESAQKTCVQLLTLNREVLVEMKDMLLSQETLSGQPLREVLSKLVTKEPSATPTMNLSKLPTLALQPELV